MKQVNVTSKTTKTTSKILNVIKINRLYNIIESNLLLLPEIFQMALSEELCVMAVTVERPCHI